MAVRVPAVDVAAREVDDDVCPVESPGPVAERDAVPADEAARRRRGTSAEDDDIVSVGDEGAGKERADLSGAAGDHDLHGRGAS